MQQEADRSTAKHVLLKELLTQLLSHGLSDAGTTIDEVALQAMLDSNQFHCSD